MFKKIEEIFSIPELRKRIFMTLLLLAIFRIGAHIPTPGVDGQALSQFFQSAENNILGFLDMFTGGALAKLTVFAMGVMPYISASIIMELLAVVIPTLAELKKEQAAEEKRQEALKEEAIQAKAKLETIVVEFKLKAHADHTPAGSISTKEVEKELKDKYGIIIDKRKFIDKYPMNAFGYTNLKIELYKDVIGTVRVHLVEETK